MARRARILSVLLLLLAAGLSQAQQPASRRSQIIRVQGAILDVAAGDGAVLDLLSGDHFRHTSSDRGTRQRQEHGEG